MPAAIPATFTVSGEGMEGALSAQDMEEAEDEIDTFMPASRRGCANTYCSSVKALATRDRFLQARSITELASAQGGRYFTEICIKK